MSKFTPGPWFTQKEVFSCVCIEARIGKGLLQEVAVCGPTQEGPDQQKANAALIADAPALLEVLEECALVLAGERLSKSALVDALEKALALIAKHKGAS